MYGSETEGAREEARPRIRRKKDYGDGTIVGDEKEDDRSRDGWTVSNETCEPSEQQKMKSMTELAGGELCLPQRLHI